ncbi:hypothetical protein [Natrinema sp. HArc-T2]|uniref:hypothetical protein n=1 Tax=Natrinema sp. HArc-T2 TaxID=3242701 RepID=UPI00359E5CE9
MQRDIDAETIQEWQTLRRNLAFANAALSIANAQRFVDGDRHLTDDNVPTQHLDGERSSEYSSTSA